MFRSQFAEPQVQHLVRSLNGFDAFVPPPLPPDLIFDGDLVMTLSDLVLFEIDQPTDSPGDVWEVANYVIATEYRHRPTHRASDPHLTACVRLTESC